MICGNRTVYYGTKGEETMKKNDFVTLTIEDIGVGGEGIGKAEGMTFFVKDAVVGDVIEARITKLKKNYGYARLMKIIKPSEKGKRQNALWQDSAVDARFRRWTIKNN